MPEAGEPLLPKPAPLATRASPTVPFCVDNRSDTSRDWNPFNSYHEPGRTTDTMLMFREPAIHNKHIRGSFGFQVLVILGTSVAAPLIFFGRFLTQSGIATQGIYNSIIASTCACILGTTLLRKVTVFPGTRGFSYVLPSYLSSYALALAAIFALRWNYNRPFLALSLGLAILTAFILSTYVRRHRQRRFYVVPFGRIDLVDSRETEWVVLDRPEPPTDINAIIVADLKFDHAPEWEKMLAEAAIRGHVVYHIKQLRESLTGRVSIDHLSENSFGSLLPNLAYVKGKRFIDLVSALVMVPILAPVFCVIAIIIKLDSPGPVFFRQNRMGYRGRVFSMIKFRTMRVRAEAAEADMIGDAMTSHNDVRVTKIGRFLRKSRFDELPQVFNIIRGEMSWIGPRPEAIALSQWYDNDIPFYSYRHIVRPGITGWAQVNQGHVTDLEAITAKLNYDFFYIKNFSFWLDILIALRTIKTMASGFGAR